jgi:hypothetical protein
MQHRGGIHIWPCKLEYEKCTKTVGYFTALDAGHIRHQLKEIPMKAPPHVAEEYLQRIDGMTMNHK